MFYAIIIHGNSPSGLRHRARACIFHKTLGLMLYLLHTGTRASCHVYCIKHEDFSCYNYVFYITTTPYLPCNKNRKELYDFYYTLVTLTTGYIVIILPWLYRIDCVVRLLRRLVEGGETHSSSMPSGLTRASELHVPSNTCTCFYIAYS